jgi:hypothetical protein
MKAPKKKVVAKKAAKKIVKKAAAKKVAKKIISKAPAKKIMRPPVQQVPSQPAMGGMGAGSPGMTKGIGNAGMYS